VGLLDWPPHLLRLIQYGRVVDLARLRERFGWEPRRSSCQVLHDYARGRGGEAVAAAVGPGDPEPAVGRPRLLEGARRG
jgi:hypothetical protein